MLDAATTTPARIRPSDFRPARWLRNRHLQTIWPSLPLPGIPRPKLVRETLELPDGDVTVIDWLTDLPQTDQSSPLLIVLHGLESSAKSTYARQLLHAAGAHGWRAAVLHFRDCGDYCNRLPRRYHAGETQDLRYLLDKLRRDGHSGPLVAAGFSLGGNVLLKYLGESGDETPLVAGVAVSVPLNLHVASIALSRGFSRVYQRYLLRRMKRSIRRKFNRFTAAFDWERALKARTFAEFDDAVTAPLHGFLNKDDYYDRCSSARYLDRITRPTLIVNALDDPFMTPDVVPDEGIVSDAVTLELSEAGGHVGFIEGGPPWHPRYYLPRRIIRFLESQL
jgi:predicted alpha/beta-fold hydrolase